MKQALPQVFSENELRRIFKAADTSKKRNRERDALIVRLLYSTGIRVSELCSIKIRDISLNTNIIEILNGKGRKQRIVKYG